MEERIKDNLVQGEEILWSSRPAAFQPMDKTHKSYYIRRSIIVAVVSAVILAAYFYSAIATSAGIKWGVVAVLLAVALYSLVSPVLDINRLRQVLLRAHQREPVPGHPQRRAQREALQHPHRQTGQG